MMSQATISASFHKIRKELADKHPQHSEMLAMAKLEFNLKIKSTYGQYRVRTNTVIIMPNSFVESEVAKMEDTIRHELAHGAVHTTYKVRKQSHGREWKAMARLFGATPLASSKKLSDEAKANQNYKYELRLGTELINGYHRKPKWAGNVTTISLKGRPDTKGKLKLIQMR
ncbi:SprT-like domain-containing protein [bacterium]|nr:SprT-like domain-containing protein [bacterium]